MFLQACDPSLEMDGKLYLDINADITKSLFDNSVESLVTSVYVAVYSAETGELVAERFSDSISQNTSIDLPSNSVVNIYALANFWQLDDNGNNVRIILPRKESELKTWIYRIDGGLNADGMHRECFNDIESYGIPMCASLQNVRIVGKACEVLNLQRLFARIELKVDHSGLVGGKYPDDTFVNEAVRVCQSNIAIRPFGSTSRAESEEDVSDAGDYEPVPENGKASRFILYVPENDKGDLLPFNDDPSVKLPPEAESGMATYIEFEGKLSPEAGYGGTLTYRFYLGSDNVRNFSVLRGSVYYLNLGFKTDSVFSPCWKLSCGEDFSDTRNFYLSRTYNGDSVICDGDKVVVRPSRPAEFYLFFNKESSAEGNQIESVGLSTFSFEAPDAQTLAWTSDALTSDSQPLAELGLNTEYDATLGKLRLSVVDESLFVPGSSRKLRFRLMPGNKEVEMTLLCYEDISVTLDSGQSTYDGFYLGMRRHINISGLAGMKIACSYSGSSCLKLKPQSDYPMLSTENEWLSSNTDVDLYAFSAPGTSGELRLYSDDAFNDGDIVASIPVVTLQPAFNRSIMNYNLPLDGTSCPLGLCYRDIYGTSIPLEKFDQQAYDLLLKPEVSVKTEYSPFVSADPSYSVNDLKIGCIVSSSGKDIRTVSSSGTVKISAPESLYGNMSVTRNFSCGIPGISGFDSEIQSDYFNLEEALDIVNAGSLYSGGCSLSSMIFVAGGPFSEKVEFVPQKLSGFNYNLDWVWKEKDFRAPYGCQTVKFQLRNINSNEIVTIGSTIDFVIKHDVVFGPFAVFKKNTDKAKVYALPRLVCGSMKRSYGEGAEAFRVLPPNLSGIDPYRLMNSTVNGVYYNSLVYGASFTSNYFSTWNISNAELCAASEEWFDEICFQGGDWTYQINPYFRLILDSFLPGSGKFGYALAN